MSLNQPSVSFPKHDIDPREKGKEWCLQAGRAIWSNYQYGMPEDSIFYSKRSKYSEIRDYGINQQSNGKYKKALTGEDSPDTSFMNIDQSTDAIVKTHRQKVLGRIKKIAYNILATPIDSLAKTKLDDYYAQEKVKILMRKALEKVNPQLAENPLVAKQPGDAEDIQELEMKLNFSPQFNRAKEAEQGISMVFYENEFDKLIDLCDEDLVDFGVAVIKEGIDANNRVYIRKVNPANFICSYSETGHFDKLSYAAEAMPVTLSHLASVFEKTDLEKIASSVKGVNGNSNYISSPTEFASGFDNFKAMVLDFEITSYDIKVTEEGRNSKGNLKFNLTNPAKLKKGNDKIEGKNYEVIYKGKWVIGTEYIYDFGLASNMKRSMDKKKITKTSLSYHAEAASFDKMKAKGITEDLMPVADEIQMTLLKLRQLNNKMITNGIIVDFSALEGVALGGSGEKALSPQQNLDMLYQIGVIGYRSENILADGKNQRKPVEPLILDYANQFTALWNNYSQHNNRMFDISGLNQTSDAASVDPKTLVGVANAQNTGTNNALYFIESARRRLVEKVAKHTVQRLQTALLMGPYEGYVQTLGKSSIDFIRLEEKNLPYDCDIMIEDRPTDDQKQMLYQKMEQDIANGFLDASDIFTVTNMYNIKDAQMVLADKVKRAKEKAQEQASIREQNMGQVQIKSAQAAEESKQQTLMLQHELKMKQIELEKGWDYKIAEMKMNMQQDQVATESATKIIQSGMGQEQPAQGVGEMMPENEMVEQEEAMM